MRYTNNTSIRNKCLVHQACLSGLLLDICCFVSNTSVKWWCKDLIIGVSILVDIHTQCNVMSNGMWNLWCQIPYFFSPGCSKYRTNQGPKHKITSFTHNLEIHEDVHILSQTFHIPSYITSRVYIHHCSWWDCVNCGWGRLCVVTRDVWCVMRTERHLKTL